jgi:hypothetical protein
MGFMDEVSSSGGAPLLKFNKEARCVKRGSDEPLNDQEFVVGIRAAKGGYLKFGEKDQAPERHMGSIFPRDEAPLRSTLGNLNKERGRPASSIGGRRRTPGPRALRFRCGTGRRARSCYSSPNPKPPSGLHGTWVKEHTSRTARKSILCR